MEPVCSGCRMKADSAESSEEMGSLLRNEFPGDLTGRGSKRCHKMASCVFCEVLMYDRSGARAQQYQGVLRVSMETRARAPVCTTHSVFAKNP